MTNYGQSIASARSRSLAVLAGSGAAIAGALIWGLIAALSRHEFSFVAVLIGLAVGATIAAVRRGAADAPLAVASAVIAITGCALGSLLGVVFVLLRNGVTGGEMLSHVNLVLHAWRSDLDALSVGFWALAAVAAVRFTLGRGGRWGSRFGYGRFAAVGLGQPGPGFGQPGPGFGQPGPGFGQPAPGHSGPPGPGFGEPAAAPGEPAPGHGGQYRPDAGDAGSGP